MATKKLTVLYPPLGAYAQSDHVNKEGTPSFTYSLEEQTLRLLMTGQLEPTFYSSAQEQAQEGVEVFERQAHNDAYFLAQAILYARIKGLLRTVLITALVILSKHGPELFQAIFPKVIRTPNDLRDFVSLCRKSPLRPGLGRSVKTACNLWLNDLSEYHAIKYGSGGNDFSLRDILRLTRPKPKDEKQAALFSYLVKGLHMDNAHAVGVGLPQIYCFEALKIAKESELQRHYVRRGRLPYEAVTGAVKPDTALWTDLMHQMPFFALLRHLNTLQKHGVFENPLNIQHVVEVLTDRQRVQRSMVLPFRYYTAYKAVVTQMPRPIQEALEVALELSFKNVPELPGRICIGSDVSGSMSGLLSTKGTTRYIDICGIFTAAILRRSEDAIVLPFDGAVRKEVKLSRRDTLMTTTGKLASIQGGATAVGAPVAWLYDRCIKVDTFIGITDGEDWAGTHWGGRGQGFGNIWREYRRRVNPAARAFLITLSPYLDWMTKQGTDGCSYTYGWSDSTAAYVIQEIAGQGSQIEAVRAIDLKASDGGGGKNTGHPGPNDGDEQGDEAAGTGAPE